VDKTTAAGSGALQYNTTGGTTRPPEWRRFKHTGSHNIGVDTKEQCRGVLRSSYLDNLCRHRPQRLGPNPTPPDRQVVGGVAARKPFIAGIFNAVKKESLRLTVDKPVSLACIRSSARYKRDKKNPRYG